MTAAAFMLAAFRGWAVAGVEGAAMPRVALFQPAVAEVVGADLDALRIVARPVHCFGSHCRTRSLAFAKSRRIARNAISIWTSNWSGRVTASVPAGFVVRPIPENGNRPGPHPDS